MQDLKVTLIQTHLVWEDIDANLSMFDAWFRRIEGGTDLVVLPEMFSTGFSVKNASCAEKMEGKSMQFLASKAAEHGFAIVGSIFINESGKLFNRFIFMLPDGRYYQYDKRHLFRMGNEHHILSGGNQAVTINYKGWKIRPMVCYDLRFPVWSRNSYANGQYEYDCLIYVANWPEIRSHAWKSLLIARAIENQAYVIGVNRVGEDAHGIAHSGDSCVIDAYGNQNCIFEPGKEEIKSAVLSGSELADCRKKLFFAQDWDNFSIDV